MGCNSTCAYCIVPAVRGREVSRRPGEIVAEVTGAGAPGRPRGDAARPERQLVGPRPAPGRSRPSSASCCAPSTRSTASSGSASRARTRRTSASRSSPRWPSATLSASTSTCRCSRARRAMLKAMRRTYSQERYLALAERLRAAVPDLALGTDIIVGFPGETEEDFAETLAVVEQVRYDSAFTFIYSPRAGTEAAAMPNQVPEEREARAAGAPCRGRAADRRRAERRARSAASRRCWSRARAARTPRCCAAEHGATRP